MNTMSKRKRQFRIVTGITTVLLVVVAIFATLLAQENTWMYDMTKDKVFTLSAESLLLLDEIEQPVQIAAVYPDGQTDGLVERLLEQYAAQSPWIAFEQIDAERDPAKLSAYQLDVKAINNETIVVKSGSRTKMVYQTSMYYRTSSGNAFDGERQISGAIRYVTSDDLPVVYQLIGHNEMGSEDVSDATELLQLEAYETKELNLVREGQVPKDASILLLLSPKKDLSPEETMAIDSFMGQGGKVLVAVDPFSSNESILENLNALMHAHGLDFTNNLVVEEDPNSFYGNNKMNLIPGYVRHGITENLAEARQYPVLPLARGIRLTEVDTEKIAVQPLLMSSDKSWMRTDMENYQSMKTETDIAGPLYLAASVMRNNADMGETDGRMVVIGNAGFISNEQIHLQANGDFFISAVNWLQGERTSSTILPKVINADTLQISGDLMKKLIVITSLVLPGIAFIGALLIWATRRNQ